MFDANDFQQIPSEIVVVEKFQLFWQLIEFEFHAYENC